jgi:hypothetical protein
LFIPAEPSLLERIAVMQHADGKHFMFCPWDGCQRRVDFVWKEQGFELAPIAQGG